MNILIAIIAIPLFILAGLFVGITWPLAMIYAGMRKTK